MRNRFKVSLKLAERSVSNLLAFGYAVVSHINGNAFFAVPHPALADLTTALDEFLVAIENAVNGGVTEIAIRNARRVTVENLLTECGHYVEDVANDPANDGNEIVVIDSAGMTVRGFSPRQKRVFSAMAGVLPGEVKLFAARVDRGTHEWAYTTTPADPDSWVGAVPTTKASTTITGLTLYQRYYFRHRAVVKTGPSPWDEPVTIVAL